MFNPDGTRLLVVRGSFGSGAALFDTTTWQQVARIEVESCQYLIALPGFEGSRMPLEVRDRCRRDWQGDWLSLYWVAPNGTLEKIVSAETAPDLRHSALVTELDPTGQRVLVWATETDAQGRDTQREVHFVVAADGATLLRLPADETGSLGLTFTRDGTGIFSPEFGPFATGLRGWRFDGSRFEPELADALPFLHSAHSKSGQEIKTYGSSAYRRSYDGTDLPTGPAFYAHVWDNLPQAVREIVNDERISVAD